jgi:hypothetical protein
MGQQSVAKFWFKPGAFGWHYVAAICDIKKLIDAYRIQTECNRHFATVYPLLQFSQTSDATNKIYPFIGALVVYTKMFL